MKGVGTREQMLLKVMKGHRAVKLTFMRSEIKFKKITKSSNNFESVKKNLDQNF